MSKGNFLRKIKQLVKGGADSSIFCSMKESDKDIIFRFEEEASLNNASIEIKHRKSGKTFEGRGFKKAAIHCGATSSKSAPLIPTRA